MIHNRPFVSSQCLVVIESNDDSEVFWNLGKWFEQIIPATKVVIRSRFSSYLYNRIRIICERYKKSFGTTFDNDCVLLDREIIEEFDYCIMCSSSVIPAPYAIDIVSNVLSKEKLYKLSNECFASSKIDDINDSLANLNKKEYTKIDNLITNTDKELNKKVSVFIPCMNRVESIKSSLPQWITQIYKNKQIVLIDYSSEIPIEQEVKNICDNYKVSLSVNQYNNSDVILFRIDNQKYFNISHAYNYAISRVKTDIICTVCADSCPRDYYLEIVSNLVDDKSLVQCWWGLHTITYDNWKKLNGHQEFIVGWGGEDDDFRYRAKLMGLEIKIIPNYYIYEITQDENKKGLYREVKDIHLSSQINTSRFDNYLSEYGFQGNYGEEIGKENTVQYRKTSGKHIKVFYCQFYKDVVIEENENINYNEELKLYYVILNEETAYWGDPAWWMKFGELKKNGFLTILDKEEINSVLEKYI